MRKFAPNFEIIMADLLKTEQQFKDVMSECRHTRHIAPSPCTLAIPRPVIAASSHGRPEAVFGQMKNNMNYKRFRHFGKDKVFMDFAFFAIAFNIKKICAKMAKEGMDWLTGLFYELTVAIFRCWEHINRRNPQNVAA